MTNTPTIHIGPAPADVTAAIHTLAGACASWPAGPMPMKPIPSDLAELDESTIASMHICHVAQGTDATASVSFSLGIFSGVFLILFCIALWRLLRTIYRRVRLFLPAWVTT